MIFFITFCFFDLIKGGSITKIKCEPTRILIYPGPISIIYIMIYIIIYINNGRKSDADLSPDSGVILKKVKFLKN